MAYVITKTGGVCVVVDPFRQPQDVGVVFARDAVWVVVAVGKFVGLAGSRCEGLSRLLSVDAARGKAFSACQ